MKKYNTKPIDYTGCHPVIAGALKRGEAIECIVWDSQPEGKVPGFVAGYCASNKYPYRCYEAGVSAWMYAEPIPRKTRRIMPPERAIPTLIENGYAFDELGTLRGEPHFIVPQMFEKMGKPLEDNSWKWPPCIIEEVEDDE